MNDVCICDVTTHEYENCPIHGFDKVLLHRDPFLANWEDDFIKEMKRQNKIKAKKQVGVRSSRHSEEVKVKMRVNP